MWEVLGGKKPPRSRNPPGRGVSGHGTWVPNGKKPPARGVSGPWGLQARPPPCGGWVSPPNPPVVIVWGGWQSGVS